MNFRACFIPDFDHDEKFIFYGDECKTKEIAEHQLDAIANYTLILHELQLMKDHSNLGWIEEKTDGEWEEIEDDDE